MQRKPRKRPKPKPAKRAKTATKAMQTDRAKVVLAVWAKAKKRKPKSTL